MKTPAYLIGLLLLFFVQQGAAQDATKPLLSAPDIDLLISTYKPMMKDFEKLGDKYEGIEDPTVLQALAANDEVRSIFKKYGWADNYFAKYVAIVHGYTYLKMEREFAKLPAEQKTYMKQALDQYQANVSGTIHMKDLELIKANQDRLEAFFDSLND